MATTRKRRFKSSSPRLPHEAISSFRPRLEPWFIDLAQLLKEQAAARVDEPEPKSKAGHISGENQSQLIKSPPAVLPAFPRTVGEMFGLLTNWGDPRLREAVKATQQKAPNEALTIDSNQVLPNMISLLKYHATVPELQRGEMKGDKKAGRRMVETLDVYNRWMHDQLPRGGVRFKTNPHHNLLMLYGLGGGLDRLTSQELADFFDEFCPCGQTHTLEVLRRLRRKLIKVLERGHEAVNGIGASS